MSNTNLNNLGGGGNTGRVSTKNVPFGIPRAIVLAPVGTVIPQSAMVSKAAFLTYVAAALINNVPSQRWQIFNNLDKFTDNTPKPAEEKTGIYNRRIYKFPPEYQWRYLANVYNFIEALSFDGCEYLYQAILLDDFGTAMGTIDPAGTEGLAFRSLTQFFVEDIMLKTVSSDTQLSIVANFASRADNNDNLKFYEAGINPMALVGLMNLWLEDVSATVQPTGYTSTTDFVITAKAGQGAIDWFATYGSTVTAACFIATDLTTGATLTISSVSFFTMSVAGQTYNVVMGVLSAAPTATHVVQIKLATPSAVNVVIPNANVVCEILNPAVNGQGGNSACKTF